VGGYRSRRREALRAYVQELAQNVISSGVEKGLEPMNAADRKVVHDAINEIDGVSTVSVGDEPRRRVVLTIASD
jgi:spoIIIJ-associated protein